MVRSSPRASAGLSRLAASPPPAAPPAPIRVWASSMKRMIGFGRGLDLGDDRLEAVLELALARPRRPAAGPGRGRGARRPCRTSGTSSWTMRSASPSTTAVLPTPGFADDDRVVLPAPGQDVDHLADLAVAAEDRVDLAGAGAGGEVDGELAQGGVVTGAGPSRRCRLLADPGLLLDRPSRNLVESTLQLIDPDRLQGLQVAPPCVAREVRDQGGQHHPRPDLDELQIDGANQPAFLHPLEQLWREDGPAGVPRPEALQDALQRFLNPRRVHLEVLEHRGDIGARVAEQLQEQVLDADLVVAA